MKPAVEYFSASPAVVLANRSTKIKISCSEAHFGFEDGGLYSVKILPFTSPKTPFSKELLLPEIERSRDTLTVAAKGGVLELEYFFYGEQKWNIHVSAIDPKEENACHRYAAIEGMKLELYSVEEDLYGLHPYKGDLHLHTNRSDGIEAPATTAANYRKAGYDFIAMTDHHIAGSAKISNAVFGELKTNFKVFDGEEVHNNQMGQIHMVNFDCKTSVNGKILGDRENTLRELEKIKNSPELEGCFDKTDIAWRIWIYREIKKSGGIAIFPHPYWIVYGAEHVSFESINYVFKNRLTDAFEIYGGVDHRENNLQALLYHEMKENGYSYPIVASTDSHSSREHGADYFGNAYTVAFAEREGGVRGALESGKTVAVQCEPNQEPNIIGCLRLSKYAAFLMDNYFPKHDELCFASGLLMHRYALGDRSAGAAIESIEGYIKENERSFFGEDII